MAVCAKDGTCLGIMTAMALPFLREAERRLPRTGPGQKPTIPDWLIAALDYDRYFEKEKDQKRPISLPYGASGGNRRVAADAGVPQSQHLLRPLPSHVPPVPRGDPPAGRSDRRGRRGRSDLRGSR